MKGEPKSLEKIGNEIANYLSDKQFIKEKEMSDLVIATIRTVVPAFVGTFVLFMAQNGISLDETAISGLVAFLVALFTAVYYVAVRLLGKRFPHAEVLLGATKTPEYK